MGDADLRVRLAAFAFLDERRKLSPDLFDRRELQHGFILAGERVPLQAPQGIFKPRVCSLPLSITTVPAREGRPRAYDDLIGQDGLLRYRYRGTNPNHPDNVGLRAAMQQRVPLIYFHGIVEGKYEAEYPVFIVGDSPESLTFTVTVDERRFASLGNVEEDPAEADIRRRYVTRTVQQRLHQQEFRERVLAAYQRHCAVCRLKQEQLLEAAHIVADREERGVPVVPNGIALCTLHHAAFDAHLIAIRPDYHIEVRRDVLEEEPDRVFVKALQPVRQHLRPDAHLLEIRYELVPPGRGLAALSGQGIDDCQGGCADPTTCRPGPDRSGRLLDQQGVYAGIMRSIMTVRMTEAELARDVHAVLEKVRHGVEVVIEQDDRPVAVLRPPHVSGRKISEVIAALEAHGAGAVLDEDFARDVEDGIKSHREPWHPPSWD